MLPTKKLIQSILGCLALGVTLAAAAAPGLVYEYGANLKVVGVRALVGIEEPMTAPIDNCDQRIADIVVDDVVYDGASDLITGLSSEGHSLKRVVNCVWDQY